MKMQVNRPAVAREVRVPPGKYVLGDPCYAVPDHLWHEVCDQINHGFIHPASDGPVEVSVPVARVSISPPTPEAAAPQQETFDVLCFSTAYGDGTYDLEDGPGMYVGEPDIKHPDGSEFAGFGVDAGLLGLVPLKLAEMAGEDAAWRHMSIVVEFRHEVLCKQDEGDLHFGPYHIDTKDS